MGVSAIVFDLDGTLVDFCLDYQALRAEVRSFLMKLGVPSSVLSLKENIFEMLRKTEIFLKNTGKSTEGIEDVHHEAFAIVERYELEAAVSTELSSGAIEALKTLKQMGLKMGICTTNSEKSVKYILNRFRISEFFDVVVTRNSVKQVKPNPEHLEVALKALNAVPEESVLVGDSGTDMLCARELKAIAVGLSTGVSTIEQLKSTGANYIVTSITDLPVLVEKISRNQ
jgi:HAD superfamily hydrolase (TIGR01549 family)